MDMILQQNEHLGLWSHAFIRISHMEKLSLRPGAQGVSVAFPASGFFCISGGSALMLLNNRVYSPNGMHIFHVPPHSRMELNAGADGLDCSIVLYEAELDSRTPADLKEEMQKCNPFHAAYHYAPAQQGMVFTLLEQMFELWGDVQPQAGMRLKGLAYQWISYVVEQYHTGQEPQKTISPVQLVTMAMEYMLDHYANPLTLETLAAAVGLSPGHLSNRFKQVLNRGPIDCLIRLRMEKACRLLEETKLPLKPIAASVGYQDVYYFSNAFKKHVGCSPTRYRQQWTARDLHSAQDNVTSEGGRYPIVEAHPRDYTDNNYYYQLVDGGSEEMFKNTKMVPASLLIAFGLLLGACGNGSTEVTTGGAGNGAQTQAEATAPAKETGGSTGAATRVVSTAKGDVEVPANPERVVTDFYLGYLLALDVKPVGTNKMFLENPYLIDQVEGIVDVSDNLEAILELEPDLIVTGSADQYEAYTKIAPTVFIENGDDVREQTKQLSIILGKEAKAEAWLQEFEEQLAEAKERVGKIIKEGEKVTVFDGGIAKNNSLYGSAYTGRTFHGHLGLPMNEKVARDIDPAVGWLSLSNEMITQYAGDYIFMAVSADKETFDYAGDPIWSTLEAVQENRLYEIDGYRFYFSDPISVTGQIRDITEMLEARAAE
ncbi:AraC family transcriptional regulator [Paenibacillus sp. PAMC21692]|uniref:AraC family transcriptional regulator n=1 Tax=Paenibacillus sp. PAMC21692 TaxID=2762320 RepID=UPI00164E92C2|nr:AraC family transcriptional regulator [Paenibacillus sp. PAMC21692]QNK58637.1 AraC family transcriptional regulator [Paenibacillus sp. PAMC21692]